MILKGSQRANGADLAIHLMNGFDNESVEIAQVSGAVAGDLLGAFAEFEAVAAGTKAKEYLYSLSINPPSPLTREQYHEAIEAIGNRLGLSDQPRAVVFHVKDGREHCHVVWSRIDVDNMKAIHMAHDRRKLMDMACDLARKFDLELPPGLKAWEEKCKFDKDALDPTLGEKAQEEATGISPEQRREEITACYEQADNAQGFINALEQKGYVLARGDRRGFVVVDEFGSPHSLTRYVKGHKAAAIKARLADITPDHLPSVDQAKELQRQRKRAQDEKEGEKQGGHAEKRRRKADQALAEKHAQRRADLLKAEQVLLTCQQAETLALHAAQLTESKGILFRVRSAVAELVGRTPGLRSVLGHIQKMTHLDPKERQELERMAVARRHGREKKDFERRKRLASRLETREEQSLEKALRREARLVRELDGKAQHDFIEAAQDQAAQQSVGSGSEDLTVDFNDAAEFVEGADRAGGGDDDRAPSWNERAGNLRPGRKARRGKGYGYRRDSD
jgi:hypothetical protein